MGVSFDREDCNSVQRLVFTILNAIGSLEFGRTGLQGERQLAANENPR
jgi:hypothetical protein